ncbi:MAG TPA: hypothetical protein DDZ80_04580 [Cyanobacteria bacterium UBA8803]|nr:hypothetical protein [Cyanobacteria bacterium UBA9273]HBL57835.1 hypothetical protein [Cyanobacteria bacterium UBA8803]
MIVVRFIIGILLVFLLHSCYQNVNASKNHTLQVKQVYTVKPDVLALRIDTGKTIYGKQVPYEAQPSDRIEREQHNNWVKRGGNYIGALVGKDRSILHTLDRYMGIPLNTDWADRPASYHITSDEDADYSSSKRPKAVFRKTKPTDMAQTNKGKFEWPLAHVLYLELPVALDPGKNYRLDFQGDNLEDLTFQYQPETTYSEAIHVSQLGFRPDDPAKVAFLSCWMGNGNGLTYPNALTFWLINEQTKQQVYTGTTKLSKASNEVEDPRDRNYTLTDVYLMDFSNFNKSGRYRVCAEGIGCSFPFEIGEHIWKDAFTISARGLYHQRSGIKLGPPYTRVVRPRPFHPDDGVTVEETTTRLMDVDMGLGKENAFSALVNTKTGQQVPNAWGGYFDAGDWDRRIQHLEVARLLLELAELFPNYFETVALNIPESNNKLPDIVDEALWGIDFYKRLQTTDGGIRGGIEIAEHPKYGETSWQNSLDVMAYAPDLWSSYAYAGVAARAAHWLAPRFPDLAREYSESAVRAMEYAEKEYRSYQVQEVLETILNDRNLAAVELFRLTGGDRWHEIFLKTTAHTKPNQIRQQGDAAFVYARTQQSNVDSTVKANAINALLQEADEAISLGANTAFKWTKMHPMHPIGWGTGLGAPKAVTLLRAHVLTNKVDYLQASVLACQFSAGANPDNLIFTTGLGHQSPQHPLLLDQRVMGQPPLPGITVYGPLDFVQFSDYWTIDLLKDVTSPNPSKWPTAEAYFDIFLSPAITEFTVWQTMGPTAYAWGYLAARN